MKSDSELLVHTCETCQHAGHEAGECKKCNCGQSELISLHGKRYLAITFEGGHVNGGYRVMPWTPQ